MTHRELHYIGEDWQGRPAYREGGDGMIYVDVNIARKEGDGIRLCDTIPETGEPDCPYVGTYTLIGAPWHPEPIHGTQDWEYINNN